MTDASREPAPWLLIASPQMGDPSFSETVVLIWWHDAEGALGVVLNRPLAHPLSEVLAEGEVDDYPGAEAVWGGPVERTQGTVVARAAIAEDEGWPLREGLSVTRSHDVLMRLVAERTDLILCLGYAGWGPGQLDTELERGDWLFTDATDALLFETPRSDLYEAALASLGLTPSQILMTPLDA
jgi:putative transcriptional regulator